MQNMSFSLLFFALHFTQSEVVVKSENHMHICKRLKPLKSYSIIKLFVINEAFITASIVGHCAILFLFTLKFVFAFLIFDLV